MGIQTRMLHEAVKCSQQVRHRPEPIEPRHVECFRWAGLHSPAMRQILFQLRTPIWVVLALLAALAPISAQQSVEAFYDARFPVGCSAQTLSSATRQELKNRLRSELKKANPAIEAIGVLEIRCALDDNKRVLGAVVLGYGTVLDQDQAYEQFRKTENIRELLANEQYGVFQFDSSLTTLRKTLTVFPSQRWRDYQATLELRSAKNVVVLANGSYGDQALRQEFNISW
jgi:hypothetical protein